MPLLSKEELNRLVGDEYKAVTFTKSVQESERVERLEHNTRYDIFLSHSSLDERTIRQINHILESQWHLKVFVDWIEMPLLDRSNVTPTTAAILRDVMDRSATLIYAFSSNATNSKWMPWELGYSDAKHGRIAVLPITEYQVNRDYYVGQEYLGLYPYINIQDNTLGERHLWVYDPEDSDKYVRFHEWRNGWNPFIHQ